MNTSVAYPLPAESSGEENRVASRTREELGFWTDAIGAPVVYMQGQALVVLGANRAASRFFGLDEAEFPHCPIERLVGPAAAQMLGQIWSVAPSGVPGEPFLIRAEVQEQERLLMVQVSKLLVDGELVRLFCFTDAPPEGSIALAGWQENIIAMLNWLPFGFEISSTDDQIQFANSRFMEMFGYAAEEIEDIEDWWRLAYPDPEYREHARSTWENSIREARAENREMVPFDMDVTTKSGVVKTIQFRHCTIGNFNVNLYLDVTQERAYARRLKTLADTDPLTAALNRRRFFEEARRLWDSPQPMRDFGVLMLDIDHFKAINDLYGHGFGDEVLVEFCRRCRAAIRADDLFARLGGEEFGVLIAGGPTMDIAAIGERVRNEVAATPFAIGGHTLSVTVSIGGAARKPRDTSIDVVVSRADKSLYRAKDDGRNKVVIAR